MGFNTSVVILNDALGSLEDDNEFGARLAAGIRAIQIKRPQDVRIGNHLNACHIIESHHADQMQPLVVGSNYGWPIEGTYFDWRGSNEEIELELLQQLAKKHGYGLRRLKGAR